MRHLAAIKRYRLPFRAALTALCAVLLCVQSASAVDDYATWGNWCYVYVITKTAAPGANVTTTQTNFPVLVRVNPGNVTNLSNAADDGSDVRFSSADGSSHLYYQMERWKHTSSTIDTGEFWVLVPSVTGNDTTKLRMYWNKGGAVDSSKPNNVFSTSNGFVGVWHYDEASGNINDATANGLNGTYNPGGVTYAQPGNIVFSGGFNGSSGFEGFGNDSRFQMDGSDKITISAWVNRAGNGADVLEGIAGKYAWASGNYREYCLVNHRTNGFAFYISPDGTSGSETGLSSSTVASNSTWYYVTGMMDASNMYIFVNGAQKASAAKTAIYGSTNANFRVGLMDDNGTIKQYWNGSIDEVRLENTNRTADWIKLCYQNQRLTNGRDSLVWFSSSSFDQNYTWDNSASSGIQTGSGTWGTDNYWTPDGNGTILSPWPGAGNTATFAGSDGTYTITINGTQYADSISFNNSTYTLSGGTSMFVSQILTGTTFGQSPPYAAGSEYDKAFDGNTGTFYDYNTADGGYTGIDLGAGIARSVAVIRFYPRAGSESRMNGGKFQGSNTSSSSGYSDLYTISGIPAGGWTLVTVSDATAYRYLRYYGPNGGYCNVADIQFITDGSINVASSKAAVISTVLDGSAGLEKHGAGTLTLSGTNTYTGTTTVTAGTLSIGAGSTTGAISNSSDVTDNATLIFNRSNTYTYSGTISGTGAIIKNGTGTTTLSANNTYTGLTTVNNGTLSLTGAPTSNALKYVINTGGTISVADRLNLSPIPAGVTADWMTINGGTFSTAIANGQNYGTNRGLTLGASGGTIEIPNTYNSNAVEVQGVITGSGALTKTGIGTLQLSGTNNYSGTTTISAGTLSIGAGGGTGAISNSSNVTDNATLQFYRTGTYTYTGAITGSGAVIQAGSGTVNLSSTSNAWGGATTISAGTLQLGAAEVIPDGSAVSLANVSATTFDLNSYAETVGSISGGGGTGGNITLGSGTLTCGGNNSNTTYSGVISGTGGLTKAGSSGTLTLSGTSTYTGVTTLSAGTVSINTLANGGSNSNIGAAAATADKLVLNGGILSYGGGAQSCDRLFTLGTSGGTIASSGSGALNLTGTGSWTISGTGTRLLMLRGTNTGSNTLAAIIANDGSSNATSLTKNDAGTWILSNTNTYTGATAVNVGALLITGSTASGSAVTVSSGGTLGGSGTINGTVSVSTGGTLSSGTGSSNTAILTVNNNLALASGAVYSAEINGTVAGTNHDQISVTGTGTVNLAGATLTLTLGYAPTTGETYTILNKASAGAITNTFNGLAEGGTATAIFNNTTYRFTVSYTGGDGNDVVLTAAGIAGEDYSTWLYSQKIFINTSPGGAGLSSTSSPIYNFPLLVRLDSTRFFHFYQTAANGADIRFANSRGGHLNYDMEYWKDNTGDNDSAAIWVLVDSIGVNSWSNYITMYWGNSSASSDADSTLVFATANNYQGVWHLKEHGTATTYYDVTSNVYHGTGVNTTTSSDVTASAGKGIALNGSTQYIYSTGFPSTALSQLTLSTWVRLDNQSAWEDIISKETGDYGSAGFGLRRTTADQFVFTFYNGGKRELTSASTFTDNSATWYYVTGTYDGAAQRLYTNGVKTDSATGLSGSIVGSANNLNIGRRVSSGDRYIAGILDEVVISNTARSSDWIKLCYQTQKLTCDTIVDIENYADWPFSQTITVNTSSSGANVSGNVTNFPMLVRLNPSNFAFTGTLANGTDIRFANSKGMHLPFEKERWVDVTGDQDTAEFWVLFDTVFGSNSTQTFTMYWGKKGKTTDISSPATVFDTANNFAGDWHLAGNFNDATINGRTGVSGTSDTNGVIGRGRKFIIANHDSIQILGTMGSPATFTLSCWTKCDSMDGANNAADLISIGDCANLRVKRTADGARDSLDCSYRYAATWYEMRETVGGANRFLRHGWRHVALVCNPSASSEILYVDGVQSGTANSNNAANFSGWGPNTQIGKYGWGTGNGWYFGGVIDEPRIESTNRNADWIKLCYETQKPLSQAAVTENYASWPYSQKIYLNTTGFSGSNISTGLGSFPVLVRLDTTNFRNFSQTLAGGADIRFANATGTHLSYEIERWKDNASNNDTAAIWVKVDTILPINGTQYINMYWGKTGAPNLSNSPMVFRTSNNFAGVWHLADNTYSDATANNYDGTSAGTSDTAGIIGRARKFNGASRDSIQIPGLMGSPATVTLSCWAKCDSIDQAGVSADMISIGDCAILRDVGGARDSINGLYHYNCAWNTTPQSNGGANNNLKNGWKHFAFVCNPLASSQTVYVNGVQVGTSTYSNALYYSCAGGTNTFIGKHGNGNTGYDFGGVIDEPRIENTNRSADWIKLCYQNQRTSQTLCDYEDYSTWRSSRRVGINTGAGGIALSGPVFNFPLLVRLDATNFDFSEANGSTDVRFARSDGTHLLYETERWDSTNKAAELWVLVDTVRSSNATQYVTMYWGKNGVFSKSNPARVFDTANGFQGSWHLSESSGNAVDATINSYSATRSGNTAQTAGDIGYGQTFDGTDDYFTATNVTKVGFGTIFTSSAWIYFASSVAGPGALWSLSDGDANWEAQETQAMLGDKTLGTAQSGRYPEFVGNTRGWMQPTNALGADGWHYITYVYNSAGPVRQIYIDGTSETLTQTSYAGGADAGSTFIIGNKVSTDVNADFNGKMDELRIENVVRSADWIKLCYETQKPSPTATITDFEAFRPCSLFTTATQCTVTTTGWTVVFDKAAGGSGGKYGGITILTDSSHGKTTGNAAVNNIASGQNLFYVAYINGASKDSSVQPSSGGAWSYDMLGNIAAHVQQTCTMNSLPFTIDYTIHGSGKMFIKVAVTNTGADIPRTKTLRFNLQRRVATNTTVSVGNNTVTLCPWVLVSCDSARHLDPLLVPFTLWNSDSGAATSATGLINTPGSGLAGYESTTWGIGAGQRQTWEFMLDFSHKSWNDSNGVGAYARSYRNPDSLEFLTGCPTLEQAWEEYLFGHWKLDETAGDSTYDNSGAGAHGVKTSAASWTTGKLGGGLTLSGSSQKVTVTNRSNLGGAAGGITVMAWIKPSSVLSPTSILIGKYSGSTGYKFFGTAGGKLSFQADATTISDTTTIGTGAWRHVAVTCNTILDSTKFYVDGRLAQISSGAYSITGNSADVLIGDGFAGTIDDVRYYGQALEESAVRAIWKLGYLPDKGMYDVRASNSNTVYLKIDGGTNKRRFPVFQIDNYWGTAAPNVGCVVDNGVALVKDVNYFTYLNTIYRKLFIAFNKTVNADSTLIYVDDSSNTGARTVAGTRKMVWGSLTGVDKRQWFWCKNFTGDYFGASSANQFYFAWKMDSATGTAGKARAGEVCRFKSSTQSPNAAVDTSTTNSLMSSQSREGGTPLGMVNLSLTAGGGIVYGLTYSLIPTYTVVESSLVRIQLQLKERTLQNGANSAKVTTRWTLYPTGQVYRWDSISYFSSPLSNSWFASSYQRFKSSPVSAIDKKRMRAVVSAADSIHDNVVAFLGFKNGNNSNITYPWIKPISGGSGYNDTILCLADIGTDRTGLEFSGDTATGGYWKQMPIQTAFYYDYQRDNITATDDDLYRDSVSNGVQCIGIAGGPALGMLAGTLVTNSAGDLNGDGFNEREGAYVVQAASNQACFILPARKDTCRYYPAFRITNYLASAKPQYVYCYHLHHIGTNDTLALLEGYDYNMYLKTASHELVFQLDSVFCDSTAFYLSPDRTLAVTLSKFNAAGGDACDTVKWRTESENENLGYYIYRRIKPQFFDSLSRAVNVTVNAADDTSLDDAALLFKRKTVVSADTGWVLVNNQIVPGAPSGASVGPRDYVHVDGRNVYNGMVYEYKVVAVDYNNKTGTYGPAEARPGRVLPVKFALSKIYPNPFRKITFIRFDLPVKTGVEMDIYNIQGKLVRRLLRPDKKYPAGFHKITWDGLNEQGQAVATGTYLCRFIANKFVNTKVMIMLK